MIQPSKKSDTTGPPCIHWSRVPAENPIPKSSFMIADAAIGGRADDLRTGGPGPGVSILQRTADILRIELHPNPGMIHEGRTQ